MRLGFHYHVPAMWKNGEIYMPGYQGVFLDSLARRVGRLVCFLHTPGKSDYSQFDYRLEEANIQGVNIGPHSSVPKRLIRASSLRGLMQNYVAELDCILLRGPSPLLPAIANICQGIPKTLLLVGNQLDGINDLLQPRWRKEIIRLFWQWNIRAQKKISSKSLTFVNSKKLFDDYKGIAPNLVEIRTTTLGEADIYIREDTCQRVPINLVYAGRVDRTKGLMVIAQAVIALIRSGVPIILNIAGIQHTRDHILDDITILFNQRELGDSLIYHGYKSLPDLFQLYRRSDIFVIASTHEGFPRAIWEAMAHSLPVVATDVGSVREYINFTAEIVPPNNVSALKGGLRHVIEDGEYRRRIIRSGRQLAHQNTLKVRSKEMIDHIVQNINNLQEA